MFTGEALTVLRGHDDTVWSVAFSPDGTRLATGADDDTVRIWDSSTGEELGTLRRHRSGVMAVVFSPDGTRLASASADKTVRLWNTVPYRVRCRQHQAILDIEPEAERIVDDVWRKANDWDLVAKRLREDTSLKGPVRRAALNLVLQRAASHSGIELSE